MSLLYPQYSHVCIWPEWLLIWFTKPLLLVHVKSHFEHLWIDEEENEEDNDDEDDEDEEDKEDDEDDDNCFVTIDDTLLFFKCEPCLDNCFLYLPK